MLARRRITPPNHPTFPNGGAMTTRIRHLRDVVIPLRFRSPRGRVPISLLASPDHGRGSSCSADRTRASGRQKSLEEGVMANVQVSGSIKYGLPNSMGVGVGDGVKDAVVKVYDEDP